MSPFLARYGADLTFLQGGGRLRGGGSHAGALLEHPLHAEYAVFTHRRIYRGFVLVLSQVGLPPSGLSCEVGFPSLTGFLPGVPTSAGALFSCDRHSRPDAKCRGPCKARAPRGENVRAGAPPGELLPSRRRSLHVASLFSGRGDRRGHLSRSDRQASAGGDAASGPRRGSRSSRRFFFLLRGPHGSRGGLHALAIGSGRARPPG